MPRHQIEHPAGIEICLQDDDPTLEQHRQHAHAQCRGVVETGNDRSLSALTPDERRTLGEPLGKVVLGG